MPNNFQESNFTLVSAVYVGGVMTNDEHSRLNISLLFLELILDLSEKHESAINELAWAAHSYIQSVALEAGLPDEEAQLLYAKLQTNHAIIEARKTAD